MERARRDGQVRLFWPVDDAAEVVRWLVEIVGGDDPRCARFASVLQERQRPKPLPVSSELFGRRKPRLGD